jgi:hypothetical protein
MSNTEMNDPEEQCAECGGRLPERLWDCFYIGSGKDRVKLCGSKCFVIYLQKGESHE